MLHGKCGISLSIRTIVFDAGEYWLKRLRNSRHRLAAIAGKGSFTQFMPYISREYCDNFEEYDEYDIAGDISRNIAFAVAEDSLDIYRDEKFKIAFAAGFLKIEHFYNEERL